MEYKKKDSKKRRIKREEDKASEGNLYQLVNYYKGFRRQKKK